MPIIVSTAGMSGSHASASRTGNGQPPVEHSCGVGKVACPAPGLMEVLIRRKDEGHGVTVNRPNENGVAENR